MKKVFIVCLALALIFSGLLIFRNRKSEVSSREQWSLTEQGATYIIHGAQDYDTGPGYYLYKIKEGKTSVARIDGENSTSLVHFTDRPVKVTGSVSINASGQVLVRISSVERAE